MKFALSPQDLKDLGSNFLIGGFIVATVSYMGTFMNPLLGAIWWSFPLSIIPVVCYMNLKGKSNKFIGNFTIQASYSIILLFAATLALGIFIKNHKDKTVTIPVCKCIAVWTILSIIFYFTVKHFNLSHYFSS